MSKIPEGKLAPAYQSWAYGAFTPAGGVFAGMQSMGMTGLLGSVTTGVSVAAATVAGGAVRLRGRGL